MFVKWKVWARFRFSGNGQLGTRQPRNSRPSPTVSPLPSPILRSPPAPLHPPHRSGHYQLQPQRVSSAAVPVWTTKLVAWVLRHEGLDRMSGLKQFILHSPRSTSSPRLLPLDPAWYILPHTPFYRVKAVSRLTVGWEFFAVDVSILGVQAVERSLGLSQLQESTFQCFEVNCTILMIFFFSRVSAEVHAVDCSRVITMSWDWPTTLCGLWPEGCLSLWPRLGRMLLFLVAWS